MDNEKYELGVVFEKCGGYGAYHYILLAKLFFGAISGIAIVNSVTLAMPATICQIPMNSSFQSLLFVSVYVGMLLGGFVWGEFSDAFGRKKLLLLLLFFTFICEAGASFALNFWHLFIMKLFLGVFGSGIMSTVYAYSNEFVSMKYKDTIIMHTGMITACCYIVQPVLAWMILPRDLNLFKLPFSNDMQFNNWRIFTLSNALIPLLGFFGLITADESPAYYIKIGKEEQAVVVLKKICLRNKVVTDEDFPAMPTTYVSLIMIVSRCLRVLEFSVGNDDELIKVISDISETV